YMSLFLLSILCCYLAISGLVGEPKMVDSFFGLLHIPLLAGVMIFILRDLYLHLRKNSRKEALYLETLSGELVYTDSAYTISTDELQERIHDYFMGEEAYTRSSFNMQELARGVEVPER